MTKYILLACLMISLRITAQTTDSLDFKIGQMIMIGYAGTAVTAEDLTLKDIQAGKVGGIVLFEKNIAPNNSYIKLKQLTTTMQQGAPLPLFMAIDQEGGKVNRLKEKYQFPKTVSAQYLGQLDNVDSTRFYAEISAATLAGLGFNVNFAPVVDLAINENNPIIAKIERSYSADPEVVARQAAEVIEAHRQFNIVSVLKHFPGHGSSHADTHLGIADVTDYWQPEELSPYQSLINADKVDAVMTAHIVNKKLDTKALPGTLSKSIVTGLLRDSLNFHGVVFSDDMQMHAITKHYGLETSIRLSVQAGVDVLIFSNNIQGSEERTVDAVHKIIRKLIANGDITEDTIDDSYKRILKLKQQWVKDAL